MRWLNSRAWWMRMVIQWVRRCQSAPLLCLAKHSKQTLHRWWFIWFLPCSVVIFAIFMLDMTKVTAALSSRRWKGRSCWIRPSMSKNRVPAQCACPSNKLLWHYYIMLDVCVDDFKLPTRTWCLKFVRDFSVKALSDCSVLHGGFLRIVWYTNCNGQLTPSFFSAQ